MTYLPVRFGDQTFQVIDLPKLLGKKLFSLPVVVRLLIENHVRAGGALDPVLEALNGQNPSQCEMLFRPNRLLMHDTTCTPALADVAGMRDAVAEAGGDPAILSPTLPVDVSVDHSLAVDAYASVDAFGRNAKNEYARNSERYAFMKWASQTLQGLRVHPPGTGIMHTINLEQLATLLEINDDNFAHPDMLLGTDSHTPMINGIGVLGWGVGGLEAETVMFGQTVSLALPKTVGVHLHGTLASGTFATDLALEITHRLRAMDVTGQFVEFFGPGVSSLSADTRAVIANMAPEYGASTGYFPVDQNTLAYLRRTGRDPVHCDRIETVYQAMGLWFDPDASPEFDRVIDIDLSTISTVISGPQRPQDRCAPAEAAKRVSQTIGRPLHPVDQNADVIPDGAVGIAAITSCTNTSDPSLLIAAGILARNAQARGLSPASWVKTSLAPGSPSARGMLERAGLDANLSALGFDVVGHGCTTCIGNSGALPDVIEQALEDGKAIAAVLSGNRNFPGRVHPKLDLGFLASPPLVVAYALKGNLHGDITADALGTDADGQPVYLSDIWPDQDEIDQIFSRSHVDGDVPQSFAAASRSKAWDGIQTQKTVRFQWDETSRNLRRPKFATSHQTSRLGHYVAKPLMVLGDDITTDHISPAGAISADSAAGEWLIQHGAPPTDLNVYAAYRGNWEVMVRGLFTNKLVRNHLKPGLALNETILSSGQVLPVFEAAQVLADSGENTLLLSGERYGMGSSRDWAAKGVALLGVRTVIARSFERIHRTNLIGMGILPLQISGDFDPQNAGITADDSFAINAPVSELQVRASMPVQWMRPDGADQIIPCHAAVETQQEVDLLRLGGVLPSILSTCLD